MLRVTDLQVPVVAKISPTKCGELGERVMGTMELWGVWDLLTGEDEFSFFCFFNHYFFIVFPVFIFICMFLLRLLLPHPSANAHRSLWILLRFVSRSLKIQSRHTL